jgi:hypothetical protein
MSFSKQLNYLCRRRNFWELNLNFVHFGKRLANNLKKSVSKRISFLYRARIFLPGVGIRVPRAGVLDITHLLFYQK